MSNSMKPSYKRPSFKGRIYSVLHKFMNDNKGSSTINNHEICIDNEQNNKKCYRNNENKNDNNNNDFMSNKTNNALISYNIINSLENSDRIPTKIDFSLYIQCFIHELRTPISTMSYCFQMLQDEYDETKRKEIIQDFKESIDFIESTLTKFSVIHNMNITLNTFEPFSIKSMINKIKSLIPHNIQYNNIEFEVNIHSDICDYYLGDPYNLNHVIINLVKNAIKYQDMSHKNKISIRVISDITHPLYINNKKMHKILIIITDTNQHILPHIKEKLFTSFNSTSGSGLGLYICKTIIELHNGIIYHEFIQPIGNRFVISIPLKIYGS